MYNLELFHYTSVLSLQCLKYLLALHLVSTCHIGRESASLKIMRKPLHLFCRRCFFPTLKLSYRTKDPADSKERSCLLSTALFI